MANPSTQFDLAVFCAFTDTLTSSISKTPYQAILRPDLENKHNMVSTGETPPRKSPELVYSPHKTALWKTPVWFIYNEPGLGTEAGH